MILRKKYPFGDPMAFAKRILLFLLLNFLVMTTIFFVVRIFNIQPYLSQYGISYLQLLIFCLLWGMGGALISLALSRKMAKWSMGVELIDEKTNKPQLLDVLHMVEKLAQKARLPEVPEVGIYHSPEINAFATGPTARRSLIAVSTGLLDKMSKEQTGCPCARDYPRIQRRHGNHGALARCGQRLCHVLSPCSGLCALRLWQRRRAPWIARYLHSLHLPI